MLYGEIFTLILYPDVIGICLLLMRDWSWSIHRLVLPVNCFFFPLIPKLWPLLFSKVLFALYSSSQRNCDVDSSSSYKAHRVLQD